MPSTNFVGDHLDGGAGNDLAVIDGHDVTAHVESIETHPFLTS